MTDATPPLSPSLRILKFLVMAMGVTMIFGFIFLLSMIYRTLGQEKQDDCQNAAIEIPVGAKVNAIAAGEKKQHIRLLVTGVEGDYIEEINLCTGEVFGHYSITSKQVD